MSPFASLFPIVVVRILQLILSGWLRWSLIMSLAACVALSLSVSPYFLIQMCFVG